MLITPRSTIAYAQREAGGKGSRAADANLEKSQPPVAIISGGHPKL